MLYNTPAIDASAEIALAPKDGEPSGRPVDAEQLAPEHQLASIMSKLDDRLFLLGKMLAFWQERLDSELPQDAPEARIPLEKIDDMLASITDLQARIASATPLRDARNS